MGTTIITFEKDPITGCCNVAFGNDDFCVDRELYRCLEEFISENAREHNDMVTKIENQRKELASLLAKNKRLEDENQKLRDINNKNFWPNGKAPVVDFPVLQYDSIPSWFDFTFTHFGYDSRKTLNLPAKITIEGVSDDCKKLEAFIEHGEVFSGIFSICRMSDIKDLVDKYNALVVDNRHLEMEKASAFDSISALQTNLKGIRKKVEVAEGEYEKMKEVLKRWHEATGCDNFEQARKKIEKLTKEIQDLKYDKEGRRTLLRYKNERLDKLHDMIWGGPGYHPLAVGGELHTAGGYLEHKGYKCFVDAVANLEADLELLRNHEIQCAEGTYPIFIHPKHMDALQCDICHSRYQAENRLIEECSELIQALAKRKRRSAERVNYIGGHELTELAHVIISAIVYCKEWGISNELLQKAVQMKYPEPYTKDTVED